MTDPRRLTKSLDERFTMRQIDFNRRIARMEKQGSTSSLITATPATHANTHQTGGTDPLTPADIGASVVKTFTLTGDASTTVFTITHNLNKRPIIIQTYDNAWAQVNPAITLTTTNTATLTFSTAPITGIFYVVVSG